MEPVPRVHLVLVFRPVSLPISLPVLSTCLLQAEQRALRDRTITLQRYFKLLRTSTRGLQENR